MYNDATLYYLNQMGIQPWITKVNSLSGDSFKVGALKLLVFIAENLSTKAQSLLQQMIFYIDLQGAELTVIPIQESDSLTNYNAKIEGHAPLAVLVLGLNQNQLLRDLKCQCPVLNSIDPDYLIANPAEKRKVFKDLNYIKQLIA